MTDKQRGDLAPAGDSPSGLPAHTSAEHNGIPATPQSSRRTETTRESGQATDNETHPTIVINPNLGRFSASWREHLYSRVVQLAVDVDCLGAQLHAECERREINAAKGRLAAAASAIEKRPTPWSAWTGADVERAWVNLHAVEVMLIRLGSPESAAAKLPDIMADARHVLQPNDPRLQRLSSYGDAEVLDAGAREAIAEVASAVHAATGNEHVRARSFRNTLLAATMVLALFSAGLAVLAASYPRVVNLCAPKSEVTVSPSASPQTTTCPSGRDDPTGTDVWLVELLGLFSASLVGSVAIRKMHGTSTPYAVPMASLVVKLPTGALTAVGGLLLVRAGVLGPAVASSATAQAVAYALLFGASQQTFTRLIDRQAQTVLDSLPSADRDQAHDDNAAKPS